MVTVYVPATVDAKLVFNVEVAVEDAAPGVCIFPENE